MWLGAVRARVRRLRRPRADPDPGAAGPHGRPAEPPAPAGAELGGALTAPRGCGWPHPDSGGGPSVPGPPRAAVCTHPHRAPHDIARSTPGFGPRSALPPLPPAPAGRTAASEPPRPPRGGSFFLPRSAAPAYNATYMRPLDALTRHASSWGRLVTMSAFAVLTAGLVMAVWWAATTEERTGTYVVRGTVNGVTLDIGDADLDIVGGGTQAALQVYAHRPLLLRPPRRGPARRARRDAAPALALPGGADRELLVRLPPARARQRAGHGRTTSGDVASSGYRGSARSTPPRAA